MDIEAEKFSFFLITWWMLEKSKLRRDSCYIVIGTCKEKVKVISEPIKRFFFDLKIIKEKKFKLNFLQNLKVKHKVFRDNFAFYLTRKIKKAKISQPLKNRTKIEQVGINALDKISNKAFEKNLEITSAKEPRKKFTLLSTSNKPDIVFENRFLPKVFLDENCHRAASKIYEIIIISYLLELYRLTKTPKEKIENIKVLQTIYMLRNRCHSTKNYPNVYTSLYLSQKNFETIQIGDTEMLVELIFKFFECYKSLGKLGATSDDFKKIKKIINYFSQKEKIKILLDSLIVECKYFVKESVLIIGSCIVKQGNKMKLSAQSEKPVFCLKIQNWYDEIIKITSNFLMILYLGTKKQNSSQAFDLVESDLSGSRISGEFLQNSIYKCRKIRQTRFIKPKNIMPTQKIRQSIENSKTKKSKVA